MLRAWLLLVLALPSCANFAQFTDALNNREITSCIAYQGSMRIGTLGGGHVAISGVTATGGASLRDCQGIGE